MRELIDRLWIVAIAAIVVFQPQVGRAEGGYAFLLKWGTLGSGNGQFNRPHGVAIDASGNVYVADQENHRIQKFTSSGGFLATWGSQGGANEEFSYPMAVAVDASGNVYVADHLNHRIQKFTSTGTFLTTWGSPGNGNGEFSFPTGVAVDASGDVYVTDTGANQRIQKFTGTGGYITQWGGGFSNPRGVAVGASGNVYVADTDNHRIQKFTSTGTFLTMWGSAGSGEGMFNYPWRLAVDATENVYVADTYNHRIQKFTGTGTFLTEWGTNGSGDGEFTYPLGIAVDAGGNVYVADNENSRIQAFCHAPTLVTDPQNQTVCVGDPVTFTVSATGSSLAYQWRKDSTLIAGGTDATYTILSAVSSDAGAYDVIVSNACGADTSAIAILTVTTTPPVSCSDSGWIPNGRPLHEPAGSYFNPAYSFLAGVADGSGGALGTWALSDARAFRVDSCGHTPVGWGSQGNPLAQRIAREVEIVSDQEGGAIVAFNEEGALLWAQRITHDGTVHPDWPANGAQLATYPAYESLSMTTADSSGAFAYFSSYITGVPYVQRVTGSGTIPPGWPAGGIALSSDGATYDSYSRKRNLAPDAAGGVYVGWRSYSDGIVRVQHVTAQGLIAAGWPTGGLEVGPTYHDVTPVLVPDDAGGVYVVWNRNGLITAQRLASSGAIAPDWPALGLDLGPGEAMAGATDGSGGLLVAWQCGPTSLDICAQRVIGNGTSSDVWPAGGALVCGTAEDQMHPSITGDGSGGAHVAWEDLRNSPDGDIYAQHLTSSGVPDPAWPGDGRLICGARSRQVNPLLVGSECGDVLVMWQDYRSGIYNPDQWVFTGQVFGQIPQVEGFVELTVDVGPAASPSLGLEAPRPNPARSRTVLNLKLGRSQSVSVTVSDIAGRTVRVLVPRARFDAGQHPLDWDLRDAAGLRVPNGLYYIRARAEGGSVETRLIVVR